MTIHNGLFRIVVNMKVFAALMACGLCLLAFTLDIEVFVYGGDVFSYMGVVERD